MSKKTRKILTIVNAILLFCFLTAALAFAIPHFARAIEKSAYADETPDATGDVIEVDDPKDDVMDYKKQSYNVTETYYEIVSIIDKATGENVTEAINAGEYTVTVKLAQGYAFKDGETQKSFTLTINQATLIWDADGDQNDEKEYRPYFDYIDKVTAAVYDSYTGTKILTYVHSQDTVEVTNADNKNVNRVMNVGVYKFSVKEDNAAVNFTNPTFTLTITPLKVDIGSSLNLFWGMGGSTELTTDAIYKYSYIQQGSVKTAFVSKLMNSAPYADWSNWELQEGPITATNAVIAYRKEVTNTVSIYNNFGYYKIEYGGERSATQSGEYKATAKLTAATANFALVYDETANKRNDIEITKESEGCYVITKTWYVVHYFNTFISESSLTEGKIVEYGQFVRDGGWTFGQFSSKNVALPYLEHGDEIRLYSAAESLQQGSGVKQPDRYWISVDGVTIAADENMQPVYRGEDTSAWENGDMDVVTFTLRLNGELICTDKPRSQLGYFVNDYTPVGNYTIIFTAKDIALPGSNDTHLHSWDSSPGGPQRHCASAYAEVEIAFDFEVRKAPLSYGDSEINANENAPALYVNLNSIKSDYTAFFGTVSSKITSDIITSMDARNSGTFWGESANSEYYFDQSLYLTYRLMGGDDMQYYESGDQIWSTVISNSAHGTYKFYYRLNAKNYVSEPDEGNFATKYFIVHVYEEVEIPQLAITKLRYNGAAQTVTLAADDERYTISDNTATVVGVYKAKLTLSDTEHYRWKGAEGAIYELEFEIMRALNGWLPNGTPIVTGWKSGEFSITQNRFFAYAIDGTPEFSITTDEQGLDFVSGLEAFTVDQNYEVSPGISILLNTLKSGTYYLWAKVNETQTHTSVEGASYKFEVGQSSKTAVETGMLTAIIVLGILAVALIAAVTVLFLKRPKNIEVNGGPNGGGVAAVEGGNADLNEGENGSDSGENPGEKRG